MPLELTPKQPPYYETGTGTGLRPTAIIGKIYIARLAQTGTNAPTAVVDTNNEITGITYGRGGAGAYTILADTNAFVTNKTWIILGPNNSPFVSYTRCYWNSQSQLTLESYTSGGVAADDLITDMTIQILVTP